MERPNSTRKRRLLQFQDFEIDDVNYRAVNKILKASAGKWDDGCSTLVDAIAHYKQKQKKNNKDELQSFLSGLPPLVRIIVTAVVQSSDGNISDAEELRLFAYGCIPLIIYISHRVPKRQRKVLQFPDFEIDQDDYHAVNKILRKAKNHRKNRRPDRDEDMWCAPYDTVGDAFEKGSLEIRKENNQDKRITKMGILGFSSCEVVLPKEIQELDALETIDLQLQNWYPCSTVVFPQNLCTLRNLKTLNINRSSYTWLPAEICHLQNLETLSITCILSQGIRFLPDTIVQLSNLKVLRLSQCEKLQYLPHDIGRLGKLETLNVFGCTSLTKLPDSINSLSSLETLNIRSCTGLTVLPADLGGLVNLKEFHLDMCSNLTMLPDSVGVLVNLKRLTLILCPRLTVLPATLSDLAGLEHFAFDPSNIQQFPEELANLTNLKFLSACCNETAPTTAVANTLARLISNQLDLEVLEIDLDCFAQLEQDTFSDRGTLKRLVLNTWPGPSYTTLPSIPSVELLSVCATSGHNEEEIFIVDTIGHCPSLKTLHFRCFSEFQEPQNLTVQISHRSPLLFPSIREVIFRNCKVKLVGSPTAPSSTSNQEEIVPMVPAIETITMTKTNVTIPNYNDLFQKLHIDSMPNLIKLEFSSNRDLKGLKKDQFEQILVGFLSRSPKISSLDLKDCGISELPPKAISLMPEKLLRLDLSKNPIFKTTSGLDSVCSVLQRCKLLVDIGRDDGRRAVALLPHRRQIGCLLSINVANSKIFMGQRIPLALWPLALEKAPNAFKIPDYIGFAGIEEGFDSIYLMLRKRAAVEVITAT